MATSKISENVGLADEKDFGSPLNSQLLSKEKTCPEKFRDLAFSLCGSKTLKHSRSSTKGGETKDGTAAIIPQETESISICEPSVTNPEQAADPDSDHGNSSRTKGISWRICRSLDASKIHGFDNELMLVRDLFQRKEDRDGFKAIGIVGVEGIGKSTLCRQLFETLDVEKDYLPRIWISMSRNEPDLVEAVQRILFRLGFEEKKLKSISRNRNLNDLLYVLHLQLTGKRYLIVLDDVKESKNWLTNLNSSSPNRSNSHLSDGLPKNSGGRVIVTTRSSAVAKAMVGEKNIHQLLPFSDPESFWKIYEQEVKNRGSEGCLDDICELKQELLDKCRGVPLVAKMLGEIKS